MSVSFTNMTKRYSGVLALDGVSLDLQPGEIQGLVGENGAGKSTLIKVIAGDVASDSGTVSIAGQPVASYGKSAAIASGIRVVYQELEILPHLTVAENLFLYRRMVTTRGFVSWRKLERTSREALETLGYSDIEPARRMRELSPGQQQLVSIARAVIADVNYLVLDEPTAALSPADVTRLFDTVRRLASQGVGILYVSHRLQEIFDLTQSVTVLKDGSKVAHLATDELTVDGLVDLMVGRAVDITRRGASYSSRNSNPKAVIEVEQLTAPPRVQNASLSVRAGEIVCLAGLVGSGRTELCEAIYGLRARTSGHVRMNGKDVHYRTPRQAIAAGISMVAENRLLNGLFAEMSISLNVISGNLRAASTGGGLVLSKPKMGSLVGAISDRLKIVRHSLAQSVKSLSGGNQQKVVVAKALVSTPGLLIIDEPTAGVDVGGRAEIYTIIRELAAEGMAVLVVSSDLTEVLTLGDRIVVMHLGRTVGEIAGEGATEEMVMRMAALGGSPGGGSR